MLTCVEICAGAGGQALGLDMAGFHHIALVEYEKEYCNVLKANRPDWNVICADVHDFNGTQYKGVDLLAGGVPCPPFSVASKQLGKDDERDLFPEAIRLIGEMKPRAVMLENVRGFLDRKFDDYREHILQSIRGLGYTVTIKLLNACDYGVPQLRPRVVIVGIRNNERGTFSYPAECQDCAPTVGEILKPLMAANGWEGVDEWAQSANKIAPTIVGGSKKHGGPDLGPVRSRRAWAELGVDGNGVANAAPEPGFQGLPKLTKEMIALIQGFPPEWSFGKKKTAACRMIGNAFPPPVARAVGAEIRRCLEMNEALIKCAREEYHKRLIENRVLTISEDGVASNADSSNAPSKAIAKTIAERLGATVGGKVKGQTAGTLFEQITMQFVSETFPKLQHLRPGSWTVLNLGNQNAIKTWDFAQYEHLAYLSQIVSENQKLSTTLGNDYMVAPDVVVYRALYEDEELNKGSLVVTDNICKMADLRKKNGGKPILHASISAKWTMRSDRAQNSRTEALNLIRNRKGHLPHIVVVTGEPLPSRLASLALGTGDLDCVYHFALYELMDAVREYGTQGREDIIETLENLVDGKRLKDISDLPLDLSC
ncbi:MAG: DNA (cytosine-5-)-methyltransferase [Clostridia bacterium]|nr:DNA (cytosine-5-)-methyltransferase [Clostridia bacterium]